MRNRILSPHRSTGIPTAAAAVEAEAGIAPDSNKTPVEAAEVFVGTKGMGRITSSSIRVARHRGTAAHVG